MSDYFIGEIRMFPWSWPPRGWALCNGAMLPIAQNSALFALIGDTYGGDGRTTFALPDLRGRTPLGQGRSPVSGNTYTYGEMSGNETVTLTVGQLPMHLHQVTAANDNATVGAPGTNYLAQPMTPTPTNLYTNPTSLVPMDPGSVNTSGGSQPHDNMQPFLTMNYCISITGIFPSRP